MGHPSGVLYFPRRVRPVHAVRLAPAGRHSPGVVTETRREHDGVVGGSFLAKSREDCFNSFLLVFPDGRYYRHDKDLPTMWENSYYIGGSDDGVLATSAGPVGVALCWELIRSQTVRRLLDKVDFVVGGSCWWDLRHPVPPQDADYQALMRNLLRQAPGDLARRLGVPVVHAAQAGEFEGLTPGNEASPYVSRFLGEAQIIDGHGNVLARLAYEDGKGIITADITPGRVEGDLAPTPEGFWAVELPLKTLLVGPSEQPGARLLRDDVVKPSTVIVATAMACTAPSERISLGVTRFGSG